MEKTYLNPSIEILDFTDGLQLLSGSINTGNPYDGETPIEAPDYRGFTEEMEEEE